MIRHGFRIVESYSQERWQRQPECTIEYSAPSQRDSQSRCILSASISLHVQMAPKTETRMKRKIRRHLDDDDFFWKEMVHKQEICGVLRCPSFHMPALRDGDLTEISKIFVMCIRC
jgi:hypothetical protein